MSSSLPLLALRAFAETGRLGSMKAAAEAMHVTPGAVSQQIKLLEDRLGQRLFERQNRALQLTKAGRSLLQPLLEGFERIDGAWQSVSNPRRRNRLGISTTAALAGGWLVPRLGRFTAAHPDIELHIETTNRLVDPRRDGIDLCLRHGLGDYPGLAAFRFLTPRLLPVCSPDFLRRMRKRGLPPIRRPADCLDYPLLQDINRVDWPLWLRCHDVDDARGSEGASFEGDLLLVQAALAGQGIALVRDIFASAELAGGRLVCVLDLPWPGQFAYYLVTRPEALRQRKVALFRDWVMGEAATDGPNDLRDRLRLTVA
ncbi:MAG TPA: LysR substrate-binding domain-containing protein [Terriglobia bacterium]|nr:LysR substrate-binding domain-containing protein [Terriglobia bacterium]